MRKFTTFKEWLKTRLDRLISVQTTSIGGEADLVAHTWDGLKVRIHLIGQPVKPRALKRVLHDATEIGVNTMFLIDARILPANGSRAPLDDWLLALHTLHGERVYAYGVHRDGPGVSQIHFERVGSTDDYLIWNGPHVLFERLRFYRTSVPHRSIRGDWLVADFNGSAFWRNTDYRAYQAKNGKHRDRQRQTTWRTWSDGKTWEEDNGIAAALPEQLEACYQMLGIEMGASREDVKAAFRRQALELHPDTSALPREEAERKFRILSSAYEYIKASQGWT